MLFLVSLCLTACLLSACTKNMGQEEIKKAEGFIYCVTYDGNGGAYGSNIYKTYALVKENSLAPAPGYVDVKTQASIKLPTRPNYELLGFSYNDSSTDVELKNKQAIASTCWYVAETDENGNVVCDFDGNPVLKSDKPWNFTTDRVNGNITLVPMWQEVYKFLVCVNDVDKEGKPVEVVLRTYKVKPGDTIAEKLYNKESGEFVDRADYIKISNASYTLIDFYMDKELTNDFSFDLVHPGSQEIDQTVVDENTGETITQKVKTNDVKIYAKYLPGKFELLTQEKVSSKPLNLSENSKWYLLEDIDLMQYNFIIQANEKTQWDALTTFNGEIYGNGYSLSNFIVTTNAMKPAGAYTAHSVFGEINGKIKDITFKNCELNVEASAYAEKVIGEQRIALIAYSVSAQGEVNNVNAEDCAINLVNASKFQSVINEQNGTLFYEITAQNVTYTVIVNGEPVSYIQPNLVN